MADRHPYRVRLHGGRNVHAARDINGGPDHTTACGYYLPEDSRNHSVTPTADIECQQCLRQIRQEETP